jgi:hypothetical protein
MHGPQRHGTTEETQLMYARRIDPIRQATPVAGRKRHALNERHRLLTDQISDLDRQLDELSHRRRQLVTERRAVRQRLFINLAKRGRRAIADGVEALPPLPANPTWLWGRRLRAACRQILARNGPLPLRDIHAALHRAGYGIDHDHAVKALADALGYETRLGRTHRPRRGVYELIPRRDRRAA